jgi:hypothetical protein
LFDDYLADNGERYSVSLEAGSYTRPSESSGYEDVSLDSGAVTTTIRDNSDPNTPNDHEDGPEADAEPVVVKIFAADEHGVPLKDSSDGHYLTANEAPEGGVTHYVALAFEPGTTTFDDTTVLNIQEGTVDFTFADGTATRDTGAGAVEPPSG